jgi:hypothetical protein
LFAILILQTPIGNRGIKSIILDITSAKKSDTMLGSDESNIDTVKQATLNKCTSHLIPARAIVVKAWEVSAHRRRETAKLLQFLELMKTMFDCGGNSRQYQ